MVTERFPIDYAEWRAEWRAWIDSHPMPKPRSNPFKGRNFLADEILGVWRVGGQAVELSAVTFPNLSERDVRGNLIDTRVRSVGITREDGTTDVVNSFPDLERALEV